MLLPPQHSARSAFLPRQNASSLMHSSISDLLTCKNFDPFNEELTLFAPAARIRWLSKCMIPWTARFLPCVALYGTDETGHDLPHG
jgi:hypothetical protein